MFWLGFATPGCPPNPPSTTFGYISTVNPQWLYLPAAVAGLMVLSAFTGFCPVYFVLNKVMPSEPAAK